MTSVCTSRIVKNASIYIAVDVTFKDKIDIDYEMHWLVVPSSLHASVNYVCRGEVMAHFQIS